MTRFCIDGRALYAVTDDGTKVWQYLAEDRAWHLVPHMTYRDMQPDFPGDYGADGGATPLTVEQARIAVANATPYPSDPLGIVGRTMGEETIKPGDLGL